MANTPYDDVFRTLLNDCSSLIIPVINEVFGEHYTGREEIVFSPNEHFMNQQDGDEEKRITDTCFEIEAEHPKKYHLECQSGTDKSMLVRLFEYDTQIALDQGGMKGDTLVVTFPHSAVLFLRGAKSMPGNMKTRMVTPGGTLEYEIPVMKTQEYTLETIFQKKLERLSLQGELSEYMKCTIVDMSGKVLGHIAANYDVVRSEVESVMGGKILEYEAKTIRNEGRREGRQEGRSEGRLQILYDLVHDGLLSVADAAKKAKLTEEAFEQGMKTYQQ